MGRHEPEVDNPYRYKIDGTPHMKACGEHPSVGWPTVRPKASAEIVEDVTQQQRCRLPAQGAQSEDENLGLAEAAGFLENWRCSARLAPNQKA
mmetsp:Transcript_30095/g.86670  ORF Transcript_30095/g.86670 Transcript_30095/m.86670 type:complete len:93 (-) Transcript_30095:6-284(-)